MPGMPIRTNWSLGQWQSHLAQLYDGQNRQRRPLETFARLVEMASGLARGVREGDHEIMQTFAPRTLAWMLGVASQLDVDLEMAVWNAYPGVCTHCHQSNVCVCRLKPEMRHRLLDQDTVRKHQAEYAKPETLLDWQAMFRGIYQHINNTIGDQKSVLHFLEELGEVSEAIRFKIAPKSPLSKDDAHRFVSNEMADLFAWMCGLANIKNLELDHYMMHIYSESCPECLNAPCRCDPYHVHSKVRLGGKRT